MSYLGHVISNKGVAMDMDKVRAIMEWETPKNLRELREFWGLTGYYRKFVAGMLKSHNCYPHSLKKTILDDRRKQVKLLIH